MIIASHDSICLIFFIIFILHIDVMVSWKTVGRKYFMEIYVKFLSYFVMKTKCKFLVKEMKDIPY